MEDGFGWRVRDKEETCDLRVTKPFKNDGTKLE